MCRTLYVTILGGLIALLAGCSGGNGQIDPSQTSPTSTAPSSTITLSGITVSPAVLLPGQSATLTAVATSSSGATLTYRWHGVNGTMSTDSANPAIWIAPNTEGTYAVSVDVTDGSGTVRGYASVAVSITPKTLLVTNILPAEAKAGELVRVIGSGFGVSQGASTVSVNGVAATSIQSWSDSEIQVRVPSTAISGDIVVNVGGINSTAGHLTVLWNLTDPANVVVSNNSGTQSTPVMAPDTLGGAFIVWVDYRNGNADLYAQHLDATGRALWSNGGVVITTAANHQLAPQIIADGSGGAIVVWHDYRNGANYNIYAQRFDTTGAMLWTSDGVAAASMSSNQVAPRLVSDGASGAVVVWQDYRSGTDFDIYAQRLDSTGAAQWAVSGISVTSAVNNQFNQQVVSDGAGGAIVAWEDYRSGTEFNIYAQRIDATGASQWAIDGISISSANGNQTTPRLVADNSGGAVIVWQDYRSASSFDIYAQHVNSAGTVGWTVNGVPVCSAAGNQINPQIIVSVTDMFTVVWEDSRNGNTDVYAQRLNTLGVAQWTGNGVAVSAASGQQMQPQMVSDDANGIIVVWEDHRTATNTNIYSQRVGAAGELLWAQGGVGISTSTGDQLSPQAIADNFGGAIVVWEDHRNSSTDIYAQGISAGAKQ